MAEGKSPVGSRGRLRFDPTWISPRGLLSWAALYACLISSLYLPTLATRFDLIMVHYIIFKLNWHPGQYETGVPSWAQFGGMLRAVKGAIGIDFVGPGLALAGLALLMNGISSAVPLGSTGRQPVLSLLGAARAALHPLWGRYRSAFLAGLMCPWLDMAPGPRAGIVTVVFHDGEESRGDNRGILLH